jgi:hypothetical protein
MSKKRTGRPRVIESGASQNVYLPINHIAYVSARAKRDLVSFSAAVRMIIEDHYRANGGVVGDLR